MKANELIEGQEYWVKLHLDRVDSDGDMSFRSSEDNTFYIFTECLKTLTIIPVESDQPIPTSLRNELIELLEKIPKCDFQSNRFYESIAADRMILLNKLKNLPEQSTTDYRWTYSKLEPERESCVSGDIPSDLVSELIRHYEDPVRFKLSGEEKLEKLRCLDQPIPTSLRDELIEWFENYGKQALAISHQPLLNKIKNLPEQGEGLKYKNKQLAIKTKQLLAKDEENQMLRNQLAEAEQERDSLKARVGDGDHVNKDEYIKFLTDSVLRMQQELEDTQDWLNKWYQSSEAYKKELSKERGAE